MTAIEIITAIKDVVMMIAASIAIFRNPARNVLQTRPPRGPARMGRDTIWMNYWILGFD